jgi:hypothetical protein
MNPQMGDRPISRLLSPLDSGKTRISVHAFSEIQPLTAVRMIEGNNTLRPRNQFDQFSLIRHQVKKQIEEERNRLEKETDILK